MALLLATILVLTFSGSLSLPASPKIEEYRLPTWYTPSSYQIQLNFPQEVFTSTGNTYTGSASIVFSVTSVTASVSLHSQHDFISITSITIAGSGVDSTTNATTILTSIPITGYSTNNVTDILTVTLGNDLIPDVVYVLVIDYSSRLSTGDMYGLYKSSYVDGGVTKYLVTSQFAATFARRAFPCFDEPALKATFDLTVTVPTGLNVLSNSRELSRNINAITGLTTVTFGTTAKMSTYLLALVVSEFTCTTGLSIGIVPYQVCSRNDSTSTRDLAVQYGPQLLASLNNFTNYDYSRGMDKMDLVAIPDFAAGAMENWGLVTYRETALLWDQNESSNGYKQRVITVVAHELSHQWFGNLVTCSWWSEIFLNEGFATYFEYHIAHEVVPSWELDKQFVLQEVHSALRSDTLQNAQSLQMECSTPAEIIARFGVISYNKGGSVLRMVEHFMQLENFRSGLQNYLLTYEYNSTVPEDLWVVLNRSVVPSVSKLPSDLLSVMYNWVTLPGYPLLTAKLSGHTVTISQRRFLFSGSDTRNEWYVPISYTTSASPNKFESTTPDVWLEPYEDVSVTLPQNASWIILNNQQTGYYRVNYDNALWYRIRAGLLRENFDGINELNRAQIVDDLFNLARADHLSYPFIFDIMRFLYNDVSYYTWYPAFNGYNFLLRRVGEDSELGELIAGRVLELMSKLYLSVPLTKIREDDQIYTLKQVLAHSWACRLGGNNCINEIRSQFTEYRETRIRPNKNIRSVVYCYAVRYSNDSTDWNFLWDLYINSTHLATEQLTILSSLGCTTDVPLLTGYLQKSITDGSGIRPQDALAVFQSVYTGSTVGVDVAFDFLVQNHVAIAEKYQSMNSLGNLINGIAERFTKQSQVDRLKEFIQNGNIPEDFSIAAKEALETAEANLRWREKYENDLFVYYSSSISISSSFLAVALAMICALFFK